MEEIFDDFKTPEENTQTLNPEIQSILQENLSEVENYKMEELDPLVSDAFNPQDILSDFVFDLIRRSGEADTIEKCSYNSNNGVAIDGWSFNGDEDLTTIDFFITKYIDSEESIKINRAELDRLFKNIKRFYVQARKRKLDKTQLDTTSDISMIVNLLEETEHIDRVRLFVVTNAIAPLGYEFENCDVEEGTSSEHYVWDARRIMQQDKLDSKTSVDIDLEGDYHCTLPFIQMPDVSQKVKCYLCIIPGAILAQIYKKYHQQILEMNVRTFLQFKGMSNKGIRDTLIGRTASKPNEVDLAPEPDMFFAYNNGISATAEYVVKEERPDGNVITEIKGLQIVNGGQTTAAISTVFGNKGNADFSLLEKVYVSMKISVVNDPNQVSEIVPRISRFANTQTAVKNSDFSINEPFLVELEKCSRAEWVKNSNGQLMYKWFFERTRGQYQDLLKKNSANTSLKKEIEAEYPKDFAFDKPLLSRFMLSWMQYPHYVSWGGETKYADFVKMMKKQNYSFTTGNFHKAIGKLILFKTIDAYYGKKGIDLPGYKANMIAYTMATLSLLTKKGLNFESIWNEQCVLSPTVMSEMTIPVEEVYAALLIDKEEVVYKIKKTETTSAGKRRNKYITRSIPHEDLEKIKSTSLYKVMLIVKQLKPLIWSFLTEVDAGVNIGTRCKQAICWENLCNRLSAMDNPFVVPQELIGAPEEPGLELTEYQKKKMETAHLIPSESWVSLLEWGKDTLQLSSKELIFINNVVARRKRKADLTYKQAKWALDIISNAKKLGWVE